MYEYLSEEVFPQSSEKELRGGSLGRSASRSFDMSASQHGSFLTGPLVTGDGSKVTPKLFIFNDGTCQVYHFIVYAAFGASICLFVEGKYSIQLECDLVHSGV